MCKKSILHDSVFAGEAERSGPLHWARPPDPLRPAVRPRPLLLPDHREQLQAHRRQDPPARAERRHGERSGGQAAGALGLGPRRAPQSPAGRLQPRRESGRSAVLQREEGLPEASAEAAAAATWATQGGPGQTEAPIGPEEEPQQTQSPLWGVTHGS